MPRTRKPYPGPKPLRPGAPITWRHGNTTRTGVVFADGPAGPRTLWAIPDTSAPGEAPAVLLDVRQPRGTAPQHATVRQPKTGDHARASRADWQTALAAAYRQCWTDPNAGRGSIGTHYPYPADIHARAQALAADILRHSTQAPGLPPASVAA